MAKKDPKTKPKKPQTRQAIIDLIKTRGPQDAQTLASSLGISAMAVRQHLYEMQAERLVTYEEEARPRGRPAKMWTLTAEADEFYPNGHAQLVVSLLKSMGKTFGNNGLDELLQTRAREQTREYKKRVKRDASLRKRLEQLVRIRTEEGYMAELEVCGKGKYMLLENHCPICEAAATCQGLCAAELEVFQNVLGTRVRVERVDHIQQGARRCAYRIEKISGKAR
ncbi:MAG: transcriptional regulator [Candidatus Hydrogenedentes bacterium]|nr:transcriptional regulator [Candidatus Hydrogenedentota bacterium]